MKRFLAFLAGKFESFYLTRFNLHFIYFNLFKNYFLASSYAQEEIISVSLVKSADNVEAGSSLDFTCSWVLNGDYSKSEFYMNLYTSQFPTYGK